MQKTSDIYKYLYHYTTWDGLIGIIKSQTLWATHYKFLNDYSEINLFRNKLVELMLPHVRDSYEQLISNSPGVLKKIEDAGGIDSVVKHDTEVLVDMQYNITSNDIYILSFCGEQDDCYINDNGLLSQWRGYGAGGGISIVFNTKKLETLLDIEYKNHEYQIIHLSDVVYSNNDAKLKEEFSEDLAILAKDAKVLFDPRVKPDGTTVLQGFSSFAQCISRYKHHGFCEEKEVRVVAFPTTLNKDVIEVAKSSGTTLKPEKERRFRAKDNGLVPYISLFDSIKAELPIEKIIVGPHREKESRAAALRIMLNKTGVQILCSDIPFIG